MDITIAGRNMMKNSRKKLFLIFALLLMVCTFTGCTKEEGIAMANNISPIIDQEGADPYVFKHGDWYYYTKTTGNSVVLIRSYSLTGISAGEVCVLYEPLSELEDLWAPEIFYMDKTWYVYFAATVPGEEMHYMYVLINENEDPFEGEWRCEPIKGMDDKFAIDGTVLELESGRYFIWSGWEGYENVQQNLYLAEMISPTEVMEEKILISVPEYEWEKHGNPLVNEGPEIIIKESTINLVYSASGSWTDDYCLGLLTAHVNDDVKLQESWVKKETPILSTKNGVYGPGHNSFTVSPDGTEDIMVYHAARWEGAGWSRSVRFAYIEFDEAGKIMDMEPVSSAERIKIPSGGVMREVYPAETFLLSEGVKLKEDADSYSSTVAEGFLEFWETASLQIESSKKEETLLHIYVKLKEFSNDRDVASLQIEINGRTYIEPIYPSAYFQPISIRTELNEGNNEIIFSSEIGGSIIAIDRVELEQY